MHHFIDFEPTRYSVTVAPLPEPRIKAESLVHGDTMLFREIEGSGTPASADITLEYNNFAQGGRKPRASVSATRSALSQYEHFATKNRRLRASLNLIRRVRKYLHASFVFDPRPDAMRDYERIGHDVLFRDRSNLSSVLYSLSRNGTDKLDELFRHIRQVPDEPYSRFDFVTTELGFSFQEGLLQSIAPADRSRSLRRIAGKRSAWGLGDAANRGPAPRPGSRE